MSFLIGSAIGLGVGAAANITGAIVSSSRAKKRLKEAESNRRNAQNRLNALESDRQDIVNPFAAAKDLSGDISNPFANLTVATGAAEIQMQQSDAALANTLDTLRATGAGAGGATALAKAALQSKRGVAANIEQQEVQNQKMAAEGEMNLQTQVLSEKKRMQQADAEGRKFVYDEREEREITAMDRAQNNIDQAEADFRQSRADKDAALDNSISFIGDAGMAFGLSQMPTPSGGGGQGGSNGGGQGNQVSVKI
jgi:hypothetical protein